MAYKSTPRDVYGYISTRTVCDNDTGPQMFEIIDDGSDSGEDEGIPTQQSVTKKKIIPPWRKENVTAPVSRYRGPALHSEKKHNSRSTYLVGNKSQHSNKENVPELSLVEESEISTQNLKLPPKLSCKMSHSQPISLTNTLHTGQGGKSSATPSVVPSASTPTALRQPLLTTSAAQPSGGQTTFKVSPNDSGFHDRLVNGNKRQSHRSVALQTPSEWLQAEKGREVPSPTSQSPNTQAIASAPCVTVNGKSYTVLSIIGTGGSSKVEKVIDFESSQLLALKSVNLANQPPPAVEAFLKEVEMLKKLQFSDRVIKLVDFENSISQNKLYLLLECGSTDLAVHLKERLSTHSLHRMQRCMFWYEMLQAVRVLHDAGIVHSDIKPANFMLVSGQIKLIDFGIAKQLDADSTSMVLENCVGTVNYMSPEVLQGVGSKAVDSKIGRKADVWSLGCILYYMTYGFTPFQSLTTFIAKLSAIVNHQHNIDMPDLGEPHLTHTLKICLLRDYKERASIYDLLDHPYVR